MKSKFWLTGNYTIWNAITKIIYEKIVASSQQFLIVYNFFEMFIKIW